MDSFNIDYQQEDILKTTCLSTWHAVVGGNSAVATTTTKSGDGDKSRDRGKTTSRNPLKTQTCNMLTIHFNINTLQIT